MTAKEMFEKLGYEYRKVGEKIYYEIPNDYELGGHSPYVVFYTINKHWDTNLVDFGRNKELIKAINKQIEELRWDNE